MKKLISILLTTILLCAFVIPVQANDTAEQPDGRLYYNTFFNWVYPNYAELKAKFPSFDPHPEYEELYYHYTDGQMDWVLVKAAKGTAGDAMINDVILGRSFSSREIFAPFMYKYGVYDIAEQAFTGLENITDSSQYLEIVDVLEELNIGEAVIYEQDNTEFVQTEYPQPTDCVIFGDYTYYVRSDGDLLLTNYTGTAANVYIPEYLNGRRVTELYYTFSDNPYIESITIPKRIRFINCAVSTRCKNLKTVYYNAENANSNSSTPFGPNGSCYVEKIILGNSVKSLFPFFLQGTQVEELDIPPNVTTLPEHTFSYSNIYKLKIPDTVTSIGDKLCYDCFWLSEVTIGNGVKSVGFQSFYMCHRLQKAILGNNIQSIGKEAFYRCEEMTTAELPDSLRVIEESAFASCYKLANLTLPENLEEIRQNAFYDTGALRRTTLNKNLKVLEEGAFHDSGLETVVIPEAITRIEYGTFSGAKNLKSLTLHNNITYIGDYAFARTDNLTEITIPESVTSIGHHAFYKANGLTEITIPDSVTKISDAVFQECENLQKVRLSRNITSITDSMFAQCAKLSNIKIPDSITRIENNAFKDCQYLVSLRIPESVKYIGDSCFYNDINLSVINIPQGVEFIGNSCFYNCRHIKSITLPDSVTEIRYNAFRLCRSLETIDIPDSVIKVGITAFHDTKWFDNQEDGVVYSGKVVYTYKGDMPKDTSLTVREGTKGLADLALNGLGNLTAVTLPDSIEYIGTCAFRSAGIKSIQLPPKVESIENYTFQYCNSLEHFTFTPAVNKVGKGALNSCKSLQSVTVLGNINSFDSTVFEDSKNLNTLYGFVDSYAHKYAKYKKWTFIPLNARGLPNELCDVNADGNIDINDATDIQRHLAGLTQINTALQPYADADGNNSVTIDDVTHIQKVLSGSIMISS